MIPETSVDNNFTRQYIPEDNSEQDHNKWSVFKDIEKVDRGLFEDIRHQIVI
jgi:hypothetical protein